MNTVLLRYAVEVEKTGSITQAAGNLGMDQPNLSKAIKTLEESLGAPVFKRTAKGMVPTAKGKLFLDHARNVLSQIDEIEALYKPAGVRCQELSLSVARASYLSYAFSRFVKRMEKGGSLNVWFRETNSSETIRDVESGEYQLGIIRYPLSMERYYSRMVNESGLTAHVLWESDFLVLLSDKHPLAAKEHVTLKDLEEYTELVHGDFVMSEAGLLDSRKKNPGQGGRRIYVFERGSQFDLLREDKETFMWVSPVPSHLLKAHGLAVKVCEDSDRRYKDVVVTRAGSRLGELEKAFLEEVKLVKEALTRYQ